VTHLLREPSEQGPIVAVSDFITAWPDMIARWVPGDWCRSLGTDGYGRSDTREALRRFFEIDAESITATVLAELAAAAALIRRRAQADRGPGPRSDKPFALRN
jgi:pyruvate dehydrogenase E1 component